MKSKSNQNPQRPGLEGLEIARRRILSSLLPLSVAFMGAAFGMAGLGLYASASSKLSIVPYVITVDRTGAVIAHEELTGQRGIPEQALASDLALFIESLRLSSEDHELEEQAVRRVYARLKENSQAFEAVERFYTGEKASLAEHSSARIENILRVSSHQFQIDWCENARDDGSRCLRAQLGYELAPLGKDLSTLRFNPLGVRITSLSLSPRDPFIKEASS